MIVITGAPRTGTSMMMQTIDILGFPVVGEKFSDTNIPEFNPKGYYELPTEEITSGILDDRYRGKAVKLFAQGLQKTIDYNINKLIVCRRDENESVESFLKLLKGSPFTPVKATLNNAQQAVHYNKQVAEMYIKVCNKPMLTMDFETMKSEPEESIKKVIKFLGIKPSEKRIKKAISNIGS